MYTRQEECVFTRSRHSVSLNTLCMHVASLITTKSMGWHRLRTKCPLYIHGFPNVPSKDGRRRTKVSNSRAISPASSNILCRLIHWRKNNLRALMRWGKRRGRDYRLPPTSRSTTPGELQETRLNISKLKGLKIQGKTNFKHFKIVTLRLFTCEMPSQGPITN